MFDGDDKRGFIEVSLDAITSVVMRGVYQNRSVADLPRRAQTDLLGRGLGRVIAHEIGHWRMGREHAPLGLMKESLNPEDLIDWVAAPLPRGWTAGDAGSGVNDESLLPRGEGWPSPAYQARKAVAGVTTPA